MEENHTVSGTNKCHSKDDLKGCWAVQDGKYIHGSSGDSNTNGLWKEENCRYTCIKYALDNYKTCKINEQEPCNINGMLTRFVDMSDDAWVEGKGKIQIIDLGPVKKPKTKTKPKPKPKPKQTLKQTLKFTEGFSTLSKFNTIGPLLASLSILVFVLFLFLTVPK